MPDHPTTSLSGWARGLLVAVLLAALLPTIEVTHGRSAGAAASDINSVRFFGSELIQQPGEPPPIHDTATNTVSSFGPIKDVVCGTIVTFLVEIEMTSTGTDDVLELDFVFGYDTSADQSLGLRDIVRLSIHPDSVDLDGDASVSLLSEAVNPTGGVPDASVRTYEPTIEVTGLDANETIWVQVDTLVGCDPGAGSSGTAQATLAGGRETSSGTPDPVGGGAQTIPGLSPEAPPVWGLTKEAFDVFGNPVVTADPFQEVTFVFTLTNAGLEGIPEPTSILDDYCTGITGPDGDLNSNGIIDAATGVWPAATFGDPPVTEAETFVWECTTTLQSGSHTNTVTLSGMPGRGFGPTDKSLDISFNPKTPAIDVTKAVSPEYIASGDSVTWTVAVANTGNAPFPSVALSDPLCSSFVLDPAGDVDGDGTLDIDEAWTYSCTSAPLTATTTNTVSAVATDPEGDTASATASATTSLVALTLDKQPPAAAIVVAGQATTWTFVVTNTGDATLSSIGVADPLTGPVTCPVTSLAPGESTTCTSSYTVTQADMDAGTISNTATASGTPPSGSPTSATDSATAGVSQTPSIQLVKSSDTVELSNVGQIVPFEFEVTNTGNVTLSSIAVTDPIVDPVNCPLTVLAPGETVTCAGDYAVTQADLDSGSFDNTATVTAGSPTGVTVSDTDTTTTPSNQDVRLSIVKVSTTTELTAVGQVVPYTFEVTNQGNVTLFGLSVTDPLIASISCPVTTLAPGASTTCTGSYTVVQADLDATSLLNTATASAFSSLGTEAIDTDGYSIPATEIIDLVMVKSSTATELTNAGQVVPYAFDVTNGSNVTVSALTVADPLAGAVSCPVTALAPGESTTCAGSYTVTQADMDAGSVTNMATASATTPQGSSSTATDSVTIPVVEAAGLSLDKDTTTTSLTSVGQVVPFTFLVTNTGNVTVDAVSISDPDVDSVSCPTTSLAPGQVATCTGSYTVTQADLDAGAVTNTATALGITPQGATVSASDTVTVPVTESPGILVDKASVTTELVAAGQLVPFTFTVTNTGNVTLSTVVVSDPLVGSVSCPATTVGPGDAFVCTGSYVVTQADLDSGAVTNTATASAGSPQGTVVSDDDTVTIPVVESPALVFDKATSTTELSAAGQVVPYTFEVTNTGNVTLSNVAVDDPLVAGMSCPLSTIGPGVTVVCTATTTIGQADLDAGGFTNTATASATSPAGTSVSQTDSVSLPTAEAASISLDKATTTTEITGAGQLIPFTFEVTNTGNVSIVGLVVDDPLVGAVTCPATALAPGSSTTCTATYTVTQADLDTGSFTNVATATATSSLGTAVSATDTFLTPADAIAEVDLVKSTTTGQLTAAGQVVDYSFAVTNTGNVTLDALLVDDPLVGAVSCPVTTLAPAESTVCTGSYTATQADLDAGSLTNTATTRTRSPFDTEVAAVDSVTVPAVETPAVVLDKSTTTVELTTVGQLVPFDFDVTNGGNVTLSALAVTDPLIGTVTCPQSTLAPGATMRCTGTHTVTLADLDAGTLTNSASVAGRSPMGTLVQATDSVTLPVTESVVLVLDKSASTATITVEGQTVAFTFEVTNIGNVTMTGLSISDPMVGGVSCPVTTLFPGTTVACTGSTTVSQDDVDAGALTNTATASATSPQGTTGSAVDTLTIPVIQDPRLSMTKSTTTTSLEFAGQVIPFTFDVVNTGNVTLDGLAILDPLIATASCPATTLAPGGSTTCTGSYTLSQADLDAGAFVNTATATAVSPLGVPTSDVDTATTPANPAASIGLVKSSPTAQLDTVGQLVPIELVVTNRGSVTLSNIVVSDPLVPTVTCPATSLSPGVSTTCTGTHTVVQTDLDAGIWTNSATVVADTPFATTVSDTDSLTISVAQAPAITISKTTATTELVAVGQVVAFELLVENAGNVTLSAIVVDDPTAGPVTCPASVLAPAESLTCTAQYTVTQDDLNLGIFTNTATVAGDSPLGVTVVSSDSITTPSVVDASLLVDKLSVQPDTGTVGEVIDYTFTVANTGAVTLSLLSVTDSLIGPATCPTSTLAPAAATTCTGSYTVTQADLDAGSITNIAEASARTPLGDLVTSNDTHVLPVVQFPSVGLVKASSVLELTAVGQDVPFTFVVTNTGNQTLSSIAVDDPAVGTVTCPVTTLSPGDGTTCTATHVVTQTDLDNGSFDNTATVAATSPTGTIVNAIDTVTTPGSGIPGIGLTKTTLDTPQRAGDIITYDFVVENTGDLTLSALVLDDPAVSGATCAATTLAPGATTACSATHVVTQTEVDEGSVVNTATVTAQTPQGATVSATDTVRTPVTAAPSVAVDKTASVTAISAVGQIVDYQIVVTNDGDLTLTGLAVDDPTVRSVTCPVSVVAPGAGTVCTASHVVTQADLDAGSLDNTAVATLLTPQGSSVSASDSVSVPVDEAGSLDVTKTPLGAPIEAAGQTLSWRITVANTGNVTLSGVSVDDPVTGPVACPRSVLAPATQMECSASVIISQAVFDAGSIDNVATVSGTTPGGTQVADQDSASTSFVQAPSIALTKAASPGQVSSPGEMISYTFDVINDGTVTLTAIRLIDDLAAPTCPATALSPGASMTCEATAAVTQADVDAGRIVNAATVLATPPFGPDVGATATASTAVSQTSDLSVDKRQPVGPRAAGATLTWFIEVVNTGTVTLSDLVVDDEGAEPVVCPQIVLAPGESVLCTTRSILTQADIDNGTLVNVAVARATPPAGPIIESTDVETVALNPEALLSLDKQGPASPASRGDTVEWGFVLTNLGDLTMTDPAIADPAAGPVTCPAATLAPGESMRCVATAVVDAAAADAGVLTNTAIASMTTPSGAVVTAVDTETVVVDQSPAIVIDKIPPVAVPSVGATVVWSFDVTNAGDVTLHSVAVLDPEIGTVVCADQVLAAGATTRCSGADLVTQADVDRGELVNVALASGTTGTGRIVTAADSERLVIPVQPQLELDKRTPATELELGRSVPYTFEVTNAGDVTLAGLEIDDALTGSVACPVTELGPGESTTCSASHTTTQADVDRGFIENTATARMLDPSGTPITSADTVRVPSTFEPAVDLDKVAEPGPYVLDDVVGWQLRVTNTGNVTVFDLEIADPTAETTSCPATVVSPGATIVCTASRTVRQADVDRGRIVNEAVARAVDPEGVVVVDRDVETIDIEQVGALRLDKLGPSGPLEAGTTVEYRFELANTGTVTLSAISVFDPRTGAVSCSERVLAPGESTICTAPYDITQRDVDAGEILNQAEVTAESPTAVVRATDEERTVVTQSPAIELVKRGPDRALSGPGDTVVYLLEVRNAGNVTLVDVVVTDPRLDAVSCPRTQLGPGESMTCAGSATLTQVEVDEGQLVNIAEVVASAPDGSAVSDSAVEVTSVDQRPSIDIDKVALDGPLLAGTAVGYSLSIVNTGNVTLRGIVASDVLVPDLDCTGDVLAPTESITCTTTYVVTQDDVDRGELQNRAEVVASGPGGVPVTDVDTEFTTSEIDSAIRLDKSGPAGPVDVGDVISWDFVVTNVGSVTLFAVSVADPITSEVVCEDTTLTAGASTSCTATSIVGADDGRAGRIDNRARVTAETTLGVTVEDDDDATVPTVAIAACFSNDGVPVYGEGCPPVLDYPGPFDNPPPPPSSPWVAPDVDAPPPTVGPLAFTGAATPVLLAIAAAFWVLGGLLAIGARRRRSVADAR